MLLSIDLLVGPEISFSPTYLPLLAQPPRCPPLVLVFSAEWFVTYWPEASRIL